MARFGRNVGTLMHPNRCLLLRIRSLICLCVLCVVFLILLASSSSRFFRWSKDVYFDERLQGGNKPHGTRLVSDNDGQKCMDSAIHGLTGVSCGPTPNSRGLAIVYTVNVTYGKDMRAGWQTVNRLLQVIRVELLRSRLNCTKLSGEARSAAKIKNATKIRIEREFWTEGGKDEFKSVLNVRIQFVGEFGQLVQPSSVDDYYGDNLNYGASMTNEICRQLEDLADVVSCDKQIDNRTSLQQIKQPNPVSISGRENLTSSHVGLFIISDGAFDDGKREHSGVLANGCLLVVEQCNMERIPASVDDRVSLNQSLPFHGEVLTVTQIHFSSYFHMTIDEMSGIAQYADFLRANPRVRIHMAVTDATRDLLRMLNIDPNRLVWGKFRAGIVYMVQGVGCGGRNRCTLCIQTLGKLLRPTSTTSTIESDINLSAITPFISTLPRSRSGLNSSETAPFTLTLPASQSGLKSSGTTTIASWSGLKSSGINSMVSTKSNPSRGRRCIVLIKRSQRRRYLANHKAVHRHLRAVSAEFNLCYVVFGDNPPPTLQKTAKIFRGAAVVVAPHGAGLANLIFSDRGTLVVEILRRDKTSTTYKSLAYQLGQRWFGMLSKTNGKAMRADVKAVDSVVRAYLKLYKSGL